MTDLSLQRSIPQELEFSDTFGVYSAGVVWMESARNEPLDIFDDKAIVSQNVKMSNPVAKMQAKEKRALKLAAPAEPFVYKSNIQRKKEAFFL